MVSLKEPNSQDTCSIPTAPPLPISRWMLQPPFRDYVIKKIKDPIRKALEAGQSFAQVMELVKTSMSRLPRMGKGNILNPTTRIIMDTANQMLSYHHNPGRERMAEAGVKLVVSEHGHDIYWAYLIDYMVIMLAIEVMKGNYKPKRLKFPVPECWSGPDLPDEKEIKRLVKEYVNG